MNDNHYPKELLSDYELLLSFFPSHKILRPYIMGELSIWKEKYGKPNDISILEIGTGFGETTDLIIDEGFKNIALVEVDRKTCDFLRNKYKDDNIVIINEDVISWIKNQPDNSFDVFTQSWVMHNFDNAERKEFLIELSRVLRNDALFIIFDKVLPKDEETVNNLWSEHIKRLSGLDKIGKTNLREELLEHEIRDSKEPYVWYEGDIFDELETNNFIEIKIIKRNDRDIVLSAILKK